MGLSGIVATIRMDGLVWHLPVDRNTDSSQAQQIHMPVRQFITSITDQL